jgi:hypothetical protein
VVTELEPANFVCAEIVEFLLAISLAMIDHDIEDINGCFSSIRSPFYFSMLLL